MADLYQRAREHAAEAFGKHEMTVMHRQGLYRHLRFQAKGTWVYGFDLVTWPGYLFVGGDISDYVFSRQRDMFEFFALDRDINPQYWAEKITPRIVTTAYDPTAVQRYVDERIADEDDPEGMREQWNQHILIYGTDEEHAARTALNTFQFGSRYPFQDAWEWDLHTWDHHFLLACFAIVQGLKLYQQSTKEDSDARTSS